MEFLTGALAGAVECMIVQPFDIIKTRYQLNPGVNAGIYKTASSLMREGGALRLYRGLLPEVAGGMPRSSAMYASQTYAQRQLTAWNGGQATTSVAVAAGIFAGVPEAVVATPFQVVKVRLQSIQHLNRYSNSLDCLRKVVAEEGVLALMQGLPTTCWRNSVWNGVYFGCMHLIKDVSDELRPTGTLAQTVYSLGIGFIGGAVATTCNAPFDVAKSRIQSEVTAGPLCAERKYHTTFQTLRRIAREEGWKAMYKGYTPKLLRMGVGGAVGITSFEFFNKLCC
eukprot:704028-Prorocentrum_minimum.AAC.1